MENYEDIRLPWQDWKIVKYLGGGAYGKVYQIERNISGIQEKAALKIISRPKDASEIEACYDNGYDKASIVASYENEIQNYVQEYKLMKELQGQSNIVSCDDFTVVPHKNGIGGDVFIRMELLTSLQQILRERTLSEAEIIKLGKDISRALILCESKKIVHRDIKPVNIMVSQFGDYKLGDFGVSKIMDHSTFATAMGTPEYQAPEVVHMEKYGQTADIYSLGITLYWLLNNRKMPFISADQMLTPMVKSEAMEKRYRGEKLPAPRDGSAKLKQIVLKACEYRPEERYASARELYEALDALKSEKAAWSDDYKDNNTISDKGRNLHKTLSVVESEMGRNKTVHVQYPDGQEKAFEVKIPVNIKSGQSIRLKGQGIAEAGTLAGDLYLDIVVTENHTKASDDGRDESDSWGNSVGTIGNPGGKAPNKQRKDQVYTAEEFNENPGDVFGKLFGSDASETVGVEKVRNKNAGKEKNAARGQNNTSDSADHIDPILKKIRYYSAGIDISISGVILAVLLGLPIIGAGCVIFTFGSVGFVFGPILIYLGLRLCSAFFREDVNTWIKDTKKNVPDLDELIKNNSEFARQLYYKKGRNKHMLDYIEKLNPVVAREIKASQNK